MMYHKHRRDQNCYTRPVAMVPGILPRRLGSFVQGPDIPRNTEGTKTGKCVTEAGFAIICAAAVAKFEARLEF